MSGIGRVVIAGVATMVASLAFGVAAAAASEVFRSDSTIIVSDNLGENNAITLSSDGTTITVTDEAGANEVDSEVDDCQQQDPDTVTCTIAPNADNSSAVRRYSVSLGEGVDSFTNVNFVADGSNVTGFGEGSKTINAGPGSQFMSGGSDDDILRGQDGDDTIRDSSSCCIAVRGIPIPPGPSGNDVVDGGAGRDEALYEREAPVTITLDGAANDGEAGEADNVQVENVVTGSGNDVVIGDAAANALVGGRGSDRLVGLGGNDELAGDFEAIVLDRPTTRTSPRRGGGPIGNFGDDSLDGGAGRDGLDCGPGFDLALREPRDDVHVNCERIGAEIVDDNSRVKGAKAKPKKRGKFKVRLECAAEEQANCVGKLNVTSDGKKVGKGRFDIPVGTTKNGKAKLNRRGLRKLRQAGGSLVVTVRARTVEPGGFATDSDRVQLHR